MPHRRARVSRAASGDAVGLQEDIARLARVVGELADALRSAERKIEADARERIRRLHEEAREQLAVLYGHHRDATRLVRQLVAARDLSSGEMQHDARQAVSEARAVADSMMARFRQAMLG